MLPEDRLIQITQRFEFLEAKLNAGPAPDEIAAISREYADLRPVVTQIAEWQAARDGLTEAQQMLADPDMRELAEDEIQRLKSAMPDLEQALRIALLPKDAAHEAFRTVMEFCLDRSQPRCQCWCQSPGGG